MDNPINPAWAIRKAERDKLFTTTEKLSNADEYQKMRYEREIEADEYVKLLQLGWTKEKAIIQARKNSDNIVQNWNSLSST